MAAITSEPVSVTTIPGWVTPVAILIAAFGIVPYIGSSYLIEAIMMPFLALSLAGVGLNLLTGYAGQVSLGSAAFMAVGAFAAFNFNLRVDGLPLVVSIVLADGTRVTHRVVDAEPMSEGTRRLTLQGDANAGPDPEPVVVTQVDRVVVSVPAVGRVLEQLGRPWWFFAAGLLSGGALLWAFGPATVARVGAWIPEPRDQAGDRR